MPSIDIPTISTSRLRLRAFRADDLDAYSAMQANPDVMRFLVNGRTHTRVEVWRNMATYLGGWSLLGYGMWVCEAADSGLFMGNVGMFRPLDWPEPELAYALDQPFWGQGFAIEAARAARDWMFANSSLGRFASFIKPENEPSKRVVERLGAVCEGTVDLRGSKMEHWVHHRH